MGVESLTLSELLCILIGSGTSRQNVFALSEEITSRIDFRTSYLGKQTEFWTNQHGIGFNKAARIVAGLELATRMLFHQEEKGKVEDARDVFLHFQSKVAGLTTEKFFILCLDSKNQILFSKEMHSGFQDFVMTDMKLIFSTILQTGAKSFICIHNHPSGQTEPSEEDRMLTSKIIQAARILDLQCLDHVIVTKEKYYSFNENEPNLFST